MDFLIQIDRQIFFLINGIQNRFLDVLFLAADWVAEYALIWIVICILIFIFDKKEKKKKILIVLTSLVLSYLAAEVVLKGFLFRERPYLVFEGIKTLGKIWKDSSFPSGHVASSAAAITAIVFVYKIKKLWKVLLPVLIISLVAFARVYSGMHYPSDVLTGALIGVICGIISVRLYGVTQSNA
jgi:undecaprenyl-diphosphatase